MNQSSHPDLGKLRDTFTADAGTTAITLFVGGILTVMGLAALTQATSGKIVLGVVGLLVTAIGVAMLYYSQVMLSARTVHVYEHGLAVKNSRSTQQWRFDEFQGVRLIGKTGGESGTSATLNADGVEAYQFTINGRPVFIVRGRFDRWEALGSLVEREVVTRLLDGYLTRIENGKTVYLPYHQLALNFSKEGLRVDAAEVVPWSQVSYERSDTTVSVFGENKKRLFAFQYVQIDENILVPNAENAVILIRLLDRLAHPVGEKKSA